MADARPFTLVLLTLAGIAGAGETAFAQPLMPGLKLHPSDLARLDPPAPARRAPVIRDRLFQDEPAAVPAWTLPFGALGLLGSDAADRGRRGFSFRIKRSRGLKGTARLRF